MTVGNPSFRNAWTTLLTKPTYLPGCLVLEYSLRSVGSKYPLVVMVSETLPSIVLDVLAARNIECISVKGIDVKRTEYKEERFKDTWTKLRCFELEQFDRLVLLDSDMLVKKNMDELMEMPLDKGWIAAAHACACNPRKIPHYPADWVPENCAYSSAMHPPDIKKNSPRPYGLLNSGLVVLTPSKEEFDAMQRFIQKSPLVPAFLFPDQDLLAELYKGKWKALPYIYNSLKTLRVIHKHLWNDDEVKNLHYILKDKPWTARPLKDRRTGEKADEYYLPNTWWWDALHGVQREMTDGSVLEEHHWKYVEGFVAH